MKDPRHRKPKLKLICCFNGAFQRRPPAGTLRYVGGEIRIVSVDRNIGFSRLKSKILELHTGPRSFSLIYHLRVDEDTPLALIKSENDVFCMIEEYEKFETLGKHPRLWIFVFNDGCMFNVRVNLRDCFLNDDDSSRVSLLNGDRKRTVVKKQGFSCSSVDSLRKIVLKQQFLANQYEKLHGNRNRTSSRLNVEETGVDFGTRPDNDDNHSFISLTDKSNTLLNDDDPHDKINASDFQLGRMPVSHSLPLNPGDGNDRVKSNISLNSQLRLGDGRDLHGNSESSDHFGEVKSSCERSGSIWSNKNRENAVPMGLGRNRVRRDFVAPSYRSNQLIGGGYPSKSAHANSHDGIRSHRFYTNDLRHLRACPYQFRGRKNTLNEMRNLKLIRLDRVHPVESVGLKSISHVSKHGQDMGSYYHAPSKLLSWPHIEKVEQMTNTTDSGLNRQIHLCNVPSQNDQHGVLEQALCKTLLKGTTNDETYCDTKKETNLISQPEVLSISTLSNNTGSINETDIRRNDKLLDKETGCKSLISHQNSDHTLQGGIECSLAVSLHNLSLTSTQKEKLITTHVATAIDIPEVSWKPNSDIVHEEQFSSGRQIEKSRKATSISFKIDEDNDEKGDVQQKPQSNSTLNDKARETQHKCLKTNGGIPTDLATFYTHLATRELQIINNSDLEYIKELGSGSYGAVFYGKWKGSDVAIKKIKPSCFSEGAMEEDRLVADFWKEVHILGQLRHPNIVALYGVVTDGPVTNLAAVTEYMVNGSLKQVLRRKDRTIDRRKRIIIAMDAAFGMEYLHGKNIVHFDLKSHNFLVNMRNPWRPVCKIGDLGLSKIKQNTLVSGGLRGTIPWMAPELLNTEKMVTEKVDVYSFGIVMWELLTGEEPYANMRPEEIIAGIIKGTLRPKIPDWCDPMWRSLMERCWSTDPDSRPGFSEIAKELRAMAAAMNIS